MSEHLPVRQIRPSAGSHFPYKSSQVTYLVGSNNGVVLPVDVTAETVKMVVNSKHELYAVWPGKERSDLFMIDKFELAKAFLSE